MSVILEHVSKAYGRQKALDDIGFRLEEGEICGFLGPNGAENHYRLSERLSGRSKDQGDESA